MTKDEIIEAVKGLSIEDAKAIWHEIGTYLRSTIPDAGVTAQDETGPGLPPSSGGGGHKPPHEGGPTS